MDWMYRKQPSFQKQYENQYSLQDIWDDVEENIQAIGYNSTITTLKDFLTGATHSQHDEEVRGILLRIRRLLSMVKYVK